MEPLVALPSFRSREIDMILTRSLILYNKMRRQARLLTTAQEEGKGNRHFSKTERKKPYISSPFRWGLDGGSLRIYRASKVNVLGKEGETKTVHVQGFSTSTIHTFAARTGSLPTGSFSSLFSWDRPHSDLALLLPSRSSFLGRTLSHIPFQPLIASFKSLTVP
jgi:hypothetical protein